MDDDVVDALDETKRKVEDPSISLGTSKSTEQNNKDDNKSTTASETNSYRGKSTQKLDIKPQITIKTKNGDNINRKSGVFIKNSKPSVDIANKDSADNITQDNSDSYVNAKISEIIVEKNMISQMNDSGDAIQMFPGLPSSSKNVQKRLKTGLGSNLNLTRITRVSLPRKSKNRAMKLLKELNNNKLLRNQHKIAKPNTSKRDQLAESYLSLSETDEDSICPSCASEDCACSECGHSCCGNAMIE